MEQKWYESKVFWCVVVVNIGAIVALFVAVEKVSMVQVIVAAIVAIINSFGAANNPFNKTGFGANEVPKEG
jgi:uncharacterized membrane protein YcaP (DUF421 family)